MDVVIVSWHHDQWLSTCLSSLEPGPSDCHRLGSVVVVDNAASLPSALLPVADVPVTVITNASNRGFAQGCNQGAARGRGNVILFLNPDTAVRPGAIAKALETLREPAHERVGLVGLRLVDASGTTQHTCGRFPSAWSMAWQALGLSRLSPRRWPGIRMTDWAHETSQAVDFACGAALLVRRPLFESLGGFDQRLFLYMEDADLSRRAVARGWGTHFRHDAVVEHACGWSSGENRPWRLAHSWRSLLVYAWSHFSPGAALLMTTVILLLAPLARMGEALGTGRLSLALDAGAAWVQLLRLLAGVRFGAGPKARAVGRLIPAEVEGPLQD